MGASAAASTSRLISASVPLAWACVCSDMRCAARASASQISRWRLAASAPACCHSWRSAAVISASEPLQASRRSRSRAASSSCNARAALGASAAASTSRLISASVPLAWVRACSEMFCAASDSASQISRWRLAASAPACCHSWRSAAVMFSSEAVQACRRSWSRAASSACSAAAALGASAAACTSRLISAMVSPACSWVWSEMRWAVSASASQISCWRPAVCAAACSHSWRSEAETEPSDAFQAARRCSSRAISAACRSAWDWLTACTSAADWRSSAAAAAARACWLSPASFSPARSWRDSAPSQTSDSLPAEASMRVDMPSISAAERCSKVEAN